MENLILVFIGAALIGAQIYVLQRVNDRSAPQADPLLSPHIATLEARLAGLEVKVEGLPSLWKQEADRAQEAAEKEYRHAQRATNAERSTAKLLEESEDAEPLPVDAGAFTPDADPGGGAQDGVLPLRGPVGDPQSQAIANARAVGLLP